MLSPSECMIISVIMTVSKNMNVSPTEIINIKLNE